MEEETQVSRGLSGRAVLDITFYFKTDPLLSGCWSHLLRANRYIDGHGLDTSQALRHRIFMTHQRFAEDIDRLHRGFTEVSQRFLNASLRSHSRLTVDSQETHRGLAEDSWTLASWRPPELWLCGHLPLAICSLVSCLLRVVGLWAASCWSWVSVSLVFGWLAAESGLWIADRLVASGAQSTFPYTGVCR